MSINTPVQPNVGPQTRHDPRARQRRAGLRHRHRIGARRRAADARRAADDLQRRVARSSNVRRLLRRLGPPSHARFTSRSSRASCVRSSSISGAAQQHRHNDWQHSGRHGAPHHHCTSNERTRNAMTLEQFLEDALVDYEELEGQVRPFSIPSRPARIPVTASKSISRPAMSTSSFRAAKCPA